MIAIDNTPVEIGLTGEELAPILWRGKQWAVTEFGIERLNGTYSLAANQLNNVNYGHDWPSLPEHMSGKSWVDIHEFCTAFLVALALFPDKHDFTPEQIQEGLKWAIRDGGDHVRATE